MRKGWIATTGTSFVLIHILVLSSPAMGQGAEPLQPITVQGAISDAPGTVVAPGTTVTVQGERADTVTIVNREEIDNKHAPVAFDALDTKPGLNVVRRLGMTGAGLSRLSIRGNGSVGPAGIQVYVDGRPDATVSFAHPTPSALGLADVESIEVIHGPSPVLHGSGKTGVVNITTADPEPGFHAFLQSSYGSFDTTENFGHVSYAGKNGFVRVGGSYRSSDGSNPDSDSEVKNINFKGKVIFNDVLDMELSAARNVDSFEVFREFFVPGPFTDPRTDELNLTQTVFDFTINANFGNVVSSLKFFHDDLDPRSQVLDPARVPGEVTERRANVTERGIRFKTEWAASQATNIIAGIDYLKAKASNSPVLQPFGGLIPGGPFAGTPFLEIPRARVHEELRETSVYLFIEQDLTESITVSGGIRHTDHSEYDDVQSGDIGIQFSPSVSDESNPLHGTTFRARATRGYQSPTLQQLFGVFRGGRNGPANPFLDPEKVHQYEVGFNKLWRNGSFDLVLYTQQGYDLIRLPTVTPNPNFNPNAPINPANFPGIPPVEIQNDVDYFNRGLEATLQLLLTENLDALIGVSINDFDQSTNRFLRVPEKTIDMGLTYRSSIFRANDFSATLVGRYAMDTYDVAPVPQAPPTPPGPRIKLDDYFVADLKINLDVNENLRMFFGIDNITDEDYELVTGVPATDLMVYTGVRLKM